MKLGERNQVSGNVKTHKPKGSAHLLKLKALFTRALCVAELGYPGTMTYGQINKSRQILQDQSYKSS